MKLSLSTAAAPERALEELEAARIARGLDGIELVVDGRRGGDGPIDGVTATRARLVAIRAEPLDASTAPELARASARLGVPVSAKLRTEDRDALAAIASTFAREGGRLLVAHGTKLDEVVEVLAALRAIGAPRSLGLAWDVRPSAEDLGASSTVLFAARDALGLVRLHGGGPEQREQDGRGLGPLFVDLALSGYDGPVVLCPSRDEERPRWSQWLASTGAAGCGSSFDVASSRLARSPRSCDVDVRDVEPKDRLEIVLGAYRSLAPAATLRLTLDHDPSCMFYTLQASEPEGSFRFRKTADGPEVWRAEVTKL
jgi:uncharacterized protein (DUF2249 family)